MTMCLTEQFMTAKHLSASLKKLDLILSEQLVETRNGIDTEFGPAALEVVRFCLALSQDLVERPKYHGEAASLAMLSLQLGDGKRAKQWCQIDAMGSESDDETLAEFLKELQKAAQTIIVSMKEFQENG